MKLPAGLDVTPDDPEYEQVVNMWMSVSQNNTMDEVRLYPLDTESSKSLPTAAFVYKTCPLCVDMQPGATPS